MLQSPPGSQISTLSLQLQIDAQPVMYHLSIVQTIASGFCDFIAQCIIVRISHSSYTYHPFCSPKILKIYRCWIVWDQNIHVVIIPSFLAIAYLGQSIYLHLISQFQFSIVSSCLASVSWLNNTYTRPLFEYCLGGPGGSNRLRRIDGREYPGNGLDRVQDPQGVLGS